MTLKKRTKWMQSLYIELFFQKQLGLVVDMKLSSDWEVWLEARKN